MRRIPNRPGFLPPRFGNTSDEHKKCSFFTKDTDTRIELSESKDGSLTVMKGTQQKVQEARNSVERELQTQAQANIDIPKDHHRKLIGKGGESLKQLEAETNTKINIPNRGDASSIIKISGNREGIEKRGETRPGAHRVPSRFLALRAWILQRTYDKLVAETGAKINIPPSHVNNEVISVTGPKEGVHRAAAVIRAIVADKEANAKPITCTVVKAQYRYIIAQQRKGLHEILKETGVSVDVGLINLSS